MNLNRSGPPQSPSRHPPGWIAAILGVVVLAIAGAVAFRIDFGGPLLIDRLPWPGEPLEAMPCVEAPFSVEPFYDDGRGRPYPPWSMVPWGLALLMIVPVVVTVRAERGRERVTDPVALVAACLAVVALLTVGQGAQPEYRLGITGHGHACMR